MVVVVDDEGEVEVGRYELRHGDDTTCMSNNPFSDDDVVRQNLQRGWQPVLWHYCTV